MFERGMVIRIECTHRGKRRGYQHAISELDLDEIMPSRPPIDVADVYAMQVAQERRKRVVDMLSAKIAHALTNALLVDLEKDRAA